MKQPFVTLQFEGRRFTQPAMPVEVLPELLAYRDLVVAVARRLFQARNPDRQRLPKGFDEAFVLQLTGVDQGSTIPVIERSYPTALDLFPASPESDLFDEARDLVEEAIEAAAINADHLPAVLTDEVLARFGAFGRTLRPDERVLVARPGGSRKVRYDGEVRRRIMRRAGGRYEEPFALIGELRKVDRDTDKYTLSSTDGRRVDVRMTPLYFPIAVRSWEGNSLLQVRGNGVYESNGKLLYVDATSVALAEEQDQADPKVGCSTPLQDQIASLAALVEGWHDGEGSAYDAADLAWVAQLLSSVVEVFGLPVPFLYPSPEGEVRSEWSAPLWEVILRLDAKARVAEAMAVPAQSGDERELRVDLRQPGGESRLGQFLARHVQPESGRWEP